MVGENIRRRRLELKLTQAQLGKMAGISESMVNQIEWGTKGMSLSTASKIAAALDRTIDYLLSEEETNGITNQRTGS